MNNKYINGFIRPDGTILEGDHHDVKAREELKNKNCFPFLCNYQEDPYMTPKENLIRAGYLLVSSYSIVIPLNPTSKQINKLLDILSEYDVDKIPEIDSESSQGLILIKTILSKFPTLSPTLKFILSYLEEIIKDKNKESGR